MNIRALPRLSAFRQTEPEPDDPQHHLPKTKSPYRDIVILSAVAISIFFVTSVYDPLAWVVDTLQDFDYLGADRILLILIGLNLVLPVLFIRRWMDLLRESAQNRETTAQLMRERKLLRTLIDHLPDYIFIKDSGGRFIISNMAHASAAQSSPEALIGKTAFESFPPEMAARFHDDDQAILRLGVPLVNAERATVDAAGRPRVVLTTKVPLRDEVGQIIGLVGISRDITERKQNEERALELAREKERVQMLSNFMHDASHDFRTPLATISTSLYLLLKSNDPARREEHATRIEEQIERLTRLIDGLNSMTRLDTLTQLELKPLDVNGLGYLLGTRYPDLHLELSEDLPLVNADEIELYQVLSQLVDNAVQFTGDEPDIRMRTFHRRGSVFIEVQDNGSGIAAKDLAHIFERFYRADEARSADSGGIGLGLSIARKIVELHGGRIEVESTLGKGSTFRIILPAV